jgi:TRAP-type C4-dicarboxylate transport system permease small subunit
MVEKHLRNIARLMARGGGYILLLTALMISVDVLLRKLFSVTLRGATELSGFSFAIAAAWAFGFTLLERAHIRVDVLYRLAPPALRGFLDALAILSLAVVTGLVAWFSGGLLFESLELGAESMLLRVPLWIPQLLCVFGLTFFFFSALYLGLRLVGLLVKRDTDTIQRLAGAMNTED